MKIHHLRNATLIIESGNHFILVDPMLGKRGTNMPLTFVKYKAKRNPTVNLPENAVDLLKKVTHCLITHCQKKHFDHLDKDGEAFLIKNNIPVSCNIKDEKYLKQKNIDIVQSFTLWNSAPFLNGKITTVPAKHGYDFMHKFMANGVGYFIELPNEPTLYISGDTVYTSDVKTALTKFKPDITVVASGTASLDLGKPILMTIDDIVRFVKDSPKKVIANHLESLNHCSTTRKQLKEVFEKENLSSKVFIPDDGESLIF